MLTAFSFLIVSGLVGIAAAYGIVAQSDKKNAEIASAEQAIIDAEVKVLTLPMTFTGGFGSTTAFRRY